MKPGNVESVNLPLRLNKLRILACLLCLLRGPFTHVGRGFLNRMLSYVESLASSYLFTLTCLNHGFIGVGVLLNVNIGARYLRVKYQRLSDSDM